MYICVRERAHALREEWVVPSRKDSFQKTRGTPFPPFRSFQDDHDPWHRLGSICFLIRLFRLEVSHPILICTSTVPSNPRSRRRLLVLLNHYKPSSTLNRKQALVHGRASTRKHLNPTRVTFVPSGMTWAPPRFNVQRNRFKLLFERSRTRISSAWARFLPVRKINIINLRESRMRISWDIWSLLFVSYYYNIIAWIYCLPRCNMQYAVRHAMLLIPSVNLTQIFVARNIANWIKTLNMKKMSH